METSTPTPSRHWPTTLGTILVVAGTTIILVLVLTLTIIQNDATQTTLYRADFSELPAVGDFNMLKHITCPVAIAPDGTAEVSYSIRNPNNTPSSTLINVYATEPNGIQTSTRLQCEQNAQFDANQTRTFTCKISASGVDGRILIVDVTGLDTRCSIAIIDGPAGMNGVPAIYASLGLSLLLLIAGSGLWFLRRRPANRFEWVRAIVGGLVIATGLLGSGVILFAPDAYWRLIASLAMFWIMLALTITLLLLLVIEGIQLVRASRRA